MEAGLPGGTVLVCLCFFFKADFSSTFVYTFHPPEVSRGAGGCSGFRAAPARASALRKSLLLLLRRVGDGGGGRCAESSARERVGESWVAHFIKWTRSASPCNGCNLSTARCSSSPGRFARRAVELALPFRALRTWRAGDAAPDVLVRLDRSTSMIAWCVELDRPSVRRCCAAGLAANASATPLSISTFSLLREAA